MEAAFLKVLNMSITAGWLILAVVLLRMIFKKAPKTVLCILWALVAIRLACPFSFESILSLIPSAETVSPNIVYSPTPSISSGIPALNRLVNPVIGDSLAPTNPTASVNPLQIYTFLAAILWLTGAAVLLLYGLIRYLRLRHRIRATIPFGARALLCDAVPSPFILGIVKPRIYLPSAMDNETRSYVICHEEAHLRRGDHLWKPLGFVLLAVHWFNPLCWLAYVLLCKDIELACDERVIKKLDMTQKKAYSEALLACSVNRRAITACPLAFGEVSVKERVKRVLNYKKPTLWVIAAAVIACAATAVCLLTNPVSAKTPLKMSGVNTGTDKQGVTIHLKNADFSGDNPFLEIEWRNENSSTLSSGTPFAIYRITDSGKISCDTLKDRVFNGLAYLIDSNATYKYSLSGFDFSQCGTYRFETKFSSDNSPGKEYTAYMEFIINDQNAITSIAYSGESIVFECGIFSSIIYTDDFIPSYFITDDMYFCTSEQPEGSFLSSMRSIGKLQELTLESQNFDRLLSSTAWDDGYFAESLRRENQAAWKTSDAQKGEFYYFLQQKNGEIYLALGYENQGNDISPIIRWIFKMKPTESWSLEPGTIRNWSTTTVGGAEQTGETFTTASPAAESFSSDSYRVYAYSGSPESIQPTLSLRESDRSFQFSYSMFSSYFAAGTYMLQDSELTCRTRDGQKVYRFRLDEESGSFVFDAANSSALPGYRYRGTDRNTEVPVPNGAIFSPVS